MEKLTWKPDHDLDTPYLRARQEWDARMGTAVIHAKNWRLATFVSLGVLVLSTGGMIFLGSRPKAVPHIVQIDAIGAPTHLGPLAPSGETYVPSEATLKYHLRRFVEDTRSISSDAALLRKNWLDAYNLVTPRGANMLTAYVGKPENDPFKRSAEQRVTVEVAAMVKVSTDTWQIDWRESTWDKSGAPAGSPSVWRGMFKISMQLPTTEEAITKNPVGLFVDEFHWDKVRS
jgi:type IV secretion system protein VirB5